ncbi:hypothetical protein [Microvirga subterranea]|uniref:Uncharacterized protein n=1 Tax=Microvirga subterranea TaxID=186651 RepID=A0A370HLZ6_9HYPH|nr:hypothetical protein [Microvirga subterranea]RDI59529.1 hypothetical protein DES45_104446 [Microvirga subterranea]
MAQPTISADSETLFANTPSDTVTTNVHYESPWSISVWRRFVGKGWIKEDLISGAASAAEAAEREKKGTLTTPPLTPGQVIEYAIFPQGVDPNGLPPDTKRFDDTVTIFALLKDSNVDLIASHPDAGSQTGGTFRFRLVATTGPTFCVMQVGQTEPAKFQNSQYFIMDDAERVLSSGPGNLHSLEAEPLVPGTTYFELTRLSDTKGNWQFINEKFDTKLRKVKLEFRKFVVHDDGDFDTLSIQNDGEAKIWFQIYQDKKKIWEETWGEGDISDEQNENEVFVNLAKDIDPERFDGNDRRIGIGVEGKEYDCDAIFFCSTENSGIQPKYPSKDRIAWIDFPTGRGKEVVNPPAADTNLTAQARPNPDDGSLHFTVHIREVVEYV